MPTIKRPNKYILKKIAGRMSKEAGFKHWDLLLDQTKGRFYVAAEEIVKMYQEYQEEHEEGDEG